MTKEFTGRAGTIDLEKMFRVELGDAERISDHLPIWAEFSAGEYPATPATTAGRTSGVMR